MGRRLTQAARPFAILFHTRLAARLLVRRWADDPPATPTLESGCARQPSPGPHSAPRSRDMASPPPNTTTAEDWTRVSGQLAAASKQLEPHGLLAGFHNHKIEWLPLAGGQRIMDILATNTPPEFVLQFDVGTCIEAGADPIAWIKGHPGRIRSVHLKDWAPGPEAQEKGYRVLFGEGAAPWKQIFDAVESVGGVEFYLMEQEGSRYSELETAQRCLATWRKMRGTA